MKNKKLFAILTLVCFMFTLMPVAAFAAVDTRFVAVDGDDSVTAYVDKAIEVGVFETEEKASTASYYFWAEDADEDVVELIDKADKTAKITFDAVGTYYVYAVEAEGLTLDADSTKAAVVAWIKDRHDAKIIDECLTVKVKQGDVKYELSTNVAKDTVKIYSDNGWTEGKGDVTVYLNKTNEAKDPVKGEEITFTTNSSYIDVEVKDDVTSRNGAVDITITASKAGTYKVYANHADADKLTITVEVTAETIDAITTVAEPKGNVALDTSFMDARGGYTGIAFELEYADGTLVEGEHGDILGGDYKVAVVDAPADSALNDVETGDLYLKYDDNTNHAWVLACANADKLSLDEEGKYTFKVTLKGGDSATATVNVVEFDEPVRMILTYESTTVAYGDNAVVKAVSYMDANGTMMTPAHPDYASYGEIKFAANGKAVKDVYETAKDDVKGGTIVTYDASEDGDEYVGTTIEALAINEDLELVATATITVVNAADGLEYQSTTADVAVNNKLIVNPVDENGNAVAAFDVAKSEATVYVLSAPANAAYSADAKVTDTDELVVTFTASAAGEYKLQTVVRTNGAYLSSVDTITVGAGEADFEDIVVVSIGADKMIVNNELVALDVAPFIENNRTMMQFNVLYVFGVDVQWVAETQSIVAEGNGLKVVMQLGSKVATVNGAEVALDVAPYSVNGRTVVPVGFLTGVLDITPVFTYNADGTIADILFAK